MISPIFVVGHAVAWLRVFDDVVDYLTGRLEGLTIGVARRYAEFLLDGRKEFFEGPTHVVGDR
jgi:hypothetical protein